MNILIGDARILVVDDSPIILQLVSTILLSHGFKNVDCVDCLKVALSKVEVPIINFDLVILDRYIGEESGLEVLKAVRRRSNEIPVLMLTQETAGGKIVEAISDGASDYILKPFTEYTLVTKVKKSLKLIPE